MIAKIAVLLFVVAAAHATLIAPGIAAPGIWNGGLIAPGVGVRAANIWGAPAIAAGPLAWGNGLYSPIGIKGAGPIAAAPLAWGNGLYSPIGIKGAGIIAAPGVVKTIL